MGVSEATGDNAVDVTYSTKPDNINVLGQKTFVTTTTTNAYDLGMVQGSEGVMVETGSKIMGVGGGVGDEAVDVTYSTKPDNYGLNIGQETISKNGQNYYFNSR